MIRRFLVIVGKLDGERFWKFATGGDRVGMNRIARLRKADRVWALGGHMSDSTWSRIRRGDHVIFARRGMPFSHLGTVSDTLEDESVAIKLWGDTPRVRLLSRLVKFSSVRDISEPFGLTCKQAGVKPGESTAIYEDTSTVPVTDIQNSHQGVEDAAGITVPKHGAVVIMIPDGKVAGPPKRVTEAVTRFRRDTDKVMRIKAIYKDTCQICKYVLDLPGGMRYSEVHHLHPLKDGGDDDFGNMLDLCARHHVEFDYRVIGVSKDGQTVVNKEGATVGTLSMASGHMLVPKNIAFHLARMREK